VNETTYLVFGDLHGRVLPAFRLALAWGREHATRVAGLLQVGDLGYFPDPGRLDKATKRHADKDPMELGVQLVTQPSRQADALFAAEDVAEALWFTLGNHEDYEALELLEHGAGPRSPTFVADAYCKLLCVRDGHVAELPGGLHVGALWGVDDRAPNIRRHAPPRGRIRERSAWQLAFSAFDVLLTHDSPRDLVFPDSGSDFISTVIQEARPAFAFFGHYHPGSRTVSGVRGRSRIFHLHGLELRGPGGSAEDGSVGVLRWGDGDGSFEYVESAWLRTFTRHNWLHR
jgi:hypothetical protein